MDLIPNNDLSDKANRESLTAFYHQAEDWGRHLIGRAEELYDSQPTAIDEIRALLAHAFRELARAELARGRLQDWYIADGRADMGHNDAIRYIDDYIRVRARALLRRAGITYDLTWITNCDSPPQSQASHATGKFLDDAKQITASESPRPAHELTRTCFMDPKNKEQAYFFSDMGCVRIYAGKGAENDYIVAAPNVSAVRWSALAKARIWGVNAALPNPEDETQIYFFSGNRYVLISITEDGIIRGPNIITDKWPSLRQAGFATVDAVMPNPSNKEEAYFFSGSKYALVTIKPDSTDDTIINGPKDIQTEWPSLKKAGFTKVDAILPRQIEHGRAFFFSDDKYVDIKIVPGTLDDQIIDGPKDIAPNWTSLVLAGIYNRH
ncbi:hypothetical protein JMJ35_010184 [Cladonia borealis]|uniref:Uncharacterized protein n=1 Tax=Cladonia borealis TaxID=184061 RepID=A0AA39U3R6_9LECA|nr:hypothetical protein JMJ35_010184 [Cladonia borealis]